MDMNDTPYFEIKNDGNFVRISAVNLIRYNSAIDFDKNWIECDIEVCGGAFQGKYSAEILTTAFESFKQDLCILYDNLNGKAIFENLENYCLISISGDGSGKLNAVIECNDKPGIYAANLTFEIDFDQTFLRSIINQLNNITQKYPIIGDLNITNNYD